MSDTLREIEELANAGYQYGFSTDLDTDIAPPGLNADVVRLISSKKNEPEWLLDWRLAAYEAWIKMDEPDWAKLNIAPIDYQAISYWAAPKSKPVLDSMDDVDPDIREMFDKLGIPLHEQKMMSNVAVVAIVDSVSVTTATARPCGPVSTEVTPSPSTSVMPMAVTASAMNAPMSGSKVPTGVRERSTTVTSSPRTRHASASSSPM